MKDHLRNAIIGFISGLIAAIAVTSIGDKEQAQQEPRQPTAPTDVQSLLDRVTALEQRAIDASHEATGTPTVQPDSPPEDSDDAEPRTQATSTFGFRQQRFLEGQQRRQRMMSDRLREAGWTDDEIASVEQTQMQVALDLEQQEYEAMRRALEEDPDRANRFQSRQQALRDSLGDDKYEQYIEATGRPASAQVNIVLEGSTAAAAGLQPGDQIRSYGSERVFNDRDLMYAIARSDPGGSVTIEVERDGATFHVTVPSGPLGTSNRSRAFALEPF